MVRTSNRRKNRTNSTDTSARLPLKTVNSLSLPSDILINIFAQLVEDDTEQSSAGLKDLHSCLLVNREWCASAAKVFWARPFHYFEGAQVVRLYLSCLRDDQQQQHQLSNETKDKAEPKTERLIDYPSLLKHLDYYSMLLSVKRWMTASNTTSHTAIPAKVLQNGNCSFLRGESASGMLTTIVMRSMLNLFVNHGVKLETLDIDTHSHEVFDIEHDDEFMVMAQPEYASLTADLKKIRIAAGFNKARLFRWLSQGCTKLQNIDIDMLRLRSYPEQADWNENGQLAALLKAQSSLVTFKISRFDADNAEIEVITPTLATQAATLRHVTFEDVDFNGCGPLHGLASCKKLQTLAFENVDNIWFDMITPLLTAKLPELSNVIAYGGICFALQAWANSFHMKYQAAGEESNDQATSASGEDGEAKKRKKSKKRNKKKNGKRTKHVEEQQPPLIALRV